MAEARSQLNHNDFFRRTLNGNYNVNIMPEQPSTKLTVRIRLHQALALHAFQALKARLQKEHNMDRTTQRGPNIVDISGIPAGYGTTEELILQIVQEYAPNAELLPPEPAQ